jgi:hypothetical protein
MAKNKSEEPEETTEETEPLAGEELEDSAGIPGQIMYPEVNVDAERAAAFAGGKVDTLDPEDEEGEGDGWQNPADRSGEVEESEEDEE